MKRTDAQALAGIGVERRTFPLRSEIDALLQSPASDVLAPIESHLLANWPGCGRILSHVASDRCLTREDALHLWRNAWDILRGL